MEENLHFKQSRLSYINNQKQKLRQKKEQIRLVKVCIGVSMVSKTANEFYVSSTINIYSYFSFTFSVVPKKVELLKISKVMCYFENCSRHTKIVNKFFD